MGDVQLNMDLSQIAPNLGGGRNYLPPSPADGWLVKIVDATLKENTDKQGSHILASAICLEGPCAGMPHDFMFNTQNKNPEAVRIANGEISAIGHCVGVLQLSRMSQLFGLPFRIVTALDAKQQEQYPGSTRVNKIMSASGLGPLEAIKGAATNANAFTTAAAPANNAFAGQPQQQQPVQQPQQQQPFQPQATAAPVTAFQPQTQQPAGTGFPAQQQPAQQPQGVVIGYDQTTGAPIYGAPQPQQQQPGPAFQPQQQPAGVFQPQG